MEASFCKKQWNVVISSQANHLHLMSGCIMQSYLENKAKDVANYTTNMDSDSELREDWRVVCVEFEAWIWWSCSWLIKMFMNIFSAPILSSLTTGLADSHTPHLRVYCVPEACAPALAATFPDAFAPHPGPKTSGHPAWPGVTPGMTPARPHHTSTHKNNIYGRNHNPTTNTTNSLMRDQETPSSDMAPDTHMQRHQHHIQHRKRGREGKNRNCWSTTTALLQCYPKASY